MKKIVISMFFTCFIMWCDAKETLNSSRLPKIINKKTVISCAALGCFIHHISSYKLETGKSLFGALSSFFAGSPCSAQEISHLQSLARLAACESSLLALYGLVTIYDTTHEYDAVLKIRSALEHAQTLADENLDEN